MTQANKVITFGCRLNAAESEKIANHIEAVGLHGVVVINSCAVTKEAERQVKQTIRRIKKENPAAQIVVTGCASQIDGPAYLAMPEVDSVIENEKKLELAAYEGLATGLQENSVMGRGGVADNVGVAAADADSALAALPRAKRVRGFLQVQNGCNHRCTFCIIPYGRGPSRSLPMGEIVAQAQALVDEGAAEIVLTGVDMTDYGSDIPGAPSLGSVVKRLLKLVPRIQRLRLSSIDVAEVDADILDLLANEPRFMPHLHISLQAGDDLVLKRMKRRHSRSDVLQFCAQARQLRPEVTFGCDVIAGFPTESDEMFSNTRELLAEAGVIHCHVFPYSERAGTPASRMPQVPVGVRRRRAGLLRLDAQQRLLAHYERQVGQVVEVVVEEVGKGRMRDYGVVACDGLMNPGEVRRVEVTGAMSLWRKRMLCLRGEVRV